MYVLGIYDGHNATVALLKDGTIVGCVSEERFTGIKNYLGFPYKSIEYLLALAGIKGSELDCVVLPMKWGVPVFSEPAARRDRLLSLSTALYKYYGVFRKIWGDVEYRLPSLLGPIRRRWYDWAYKYIGVRTMDHKRTFIADLLGLNVSRVMTVEHHQAHAAAAYYGSPYCKEDALVLTIDGEGDLLSATVNTVRKGRWQRIAQTPADASLGFIYLELTGYMGMKRNEHEYKVMGLAPYAKEYGVMPLYEKIKDLIVLDPGNSLRFKAKFDTHLTMKYLQSEMREQRFDYIAGAFQKLVEERVSEWVSAAVEKTKLHTVCMGGGVVMNVKANLKIAELSSVKEFFPCPSAGDESTAIGACYWAYTTLLHGGKKVKATQPFGPLYLGPAYSDEQVRDFISKGKYDKKYRVEYVRDIEVHVAWLVADDKVVARVSGRMEWGARALGNRSIMANPSNADLVRVINEQMKMRDFWMPFTPSILKDRAKDYIVNPKNIPAPYMILTFNSTELARKHLKAAMHPYDFTLRPQLVEESWNPGYYKIIKEFDKLTGIGGILNTSFNLHGLPIVLGPKEAMYAFEHSGLEYLAVEHYLISKK